MAENSTVIFKGKELTFLEKVFIEDLVEKFGVFDSELLPEGQPFEALRKYDLGLVKGVTIDTDGAVIIFTNSPEELIDDLIEFTGFRNLQPHYPHFESYKRGNPFHQVYLEEYIVALTQVDAMSGFQWK